MGESQSLSIICRESFFKCWREFIFVYGIWDVLQNIKREGILDSHYGYFKLKVFSFLFQRSGCPYLKVRSVLIPAFRISSAISPHFVWITKENYNFPYLLIFSDFSMLNISLSTIKYTSQQRDLCPCLNIGWKKCSSSKLRFNIRHIIFINPFQANVPFLYPQKTSEKRRFSDIFRGYRKGTLA